MSKFPAYPPLNGLVDLACRKGVDIRPTLLRVLTDLYVQKPTHSADEERQYVELALGLVGSVDESTRRAVAARLSAYMAAPAAVLAKLSEVSGPKYDTPLTEPDEAQPAPRNDLLESFFAASIEERRLILTNLDAAVEPRSVHPGPAAGEVIRRLENAALQRNPGEFSRMLENALGISRALAERITRDHTGEPIVVAARALGMSAAVFQRILLFLNPEVGQSIPRVYDLARLFDELTPAAAEKMLAIWRTAGGRSPAAHVPLHWNDERRDARSVSAHSRHRSDRVEQPTRVRHADPCQA